MEAGLRAITGVNGAEGVTVSVGGVSSWVNPGIAEDNFFIPRPFVEFPPPLDEPGTATADRGDDPGSADEVGLDRAPATERDVVDVVIVADDFGRTTALDVPELSTVVSLL